MVKEILENSGKALGLALGCGISLSIIDDFSASSIVMPEALSSWIQYSTTPSCCNASNQWLPNDWLGQRPLCFF